MEGELQKIDTENCHIEDEKITFTVGGGCFLGGDPKDTSGTWEKSVCKFLNDRGFAFPILGGEFVEGP